MQCSFTFHYGEFWQLRGSILESLDAKNEAPMTEPLVLWSVALAGFGAALSLFFGITLLMQRSAQPANDYLAAFCACFALLMMGDIWLNALGSYSYHWSSNALDAVFLLLPPLFYFYVTTLVTGVRPRLSELLLCLVPAALCGLWFAAQLALASAIQVNAAPGHTEFMPTAYSVVFALLAVAQLLGYCFAAFRLINAHARNAENTYSSLQKVNLSWVQALIWGASVAALFWVLGIAVQHPFWAAANSALPAVMMLTLGILAQRQAPINTLLEIRLPDDLPTASHPPATSASNKYAKSGLTNERMQALADQLAQFMAEDKAFLEGDLTLGDLADRVGVPQHHISQVLNQHLACSFFEYVNRLRVKEAERCLADPAFSDQTVLEVGFAAGFNSKAAFNSAFKRFAGTTPSAYRALPR
jgi:AraC-like DNA-binding protein